MKTNWKKRNKLKKKKKQTKKKTKISNVVLKINCDEHQTDELRTREKSKKNDNNTLWERPRERLRKVRHVCVCMSEIESWVSRPARQNEMKICSWAVETTRLFHCFHRVCSSHYPNMLSDGGDRSSTVNRTTNRQKLRHSKLYPCLLLVSWFGQKIHFMENTNKH